jgi:maltose/moltooligosaccharide transporter
VEWLKGSETAGGELALKQTEGAVAGFIGTKLGRRRTISIGLVGMIASFMTTLAQVGVVLVAAGLCWALININAYPMVVELCRPSQHGTYTGLYYIFSMSAGIGGPFVVGLLFDLAGSKRPLFLASALFMAIALALMLTVRQSEASPKAEAA